MPRELSELHLAIEATRPKSYLIGETPNANLLLGCNCCLVQLTIWRVRVQKITEFPVITTKRLLLREPQISDAADYFVIGSDAEVQKYNAPVMQNVTESETLLAEVRAEYAAGEGISWVVTMGESHPVLGLFGFYHWSHYHRRAELGYALARDYWGQGFGTEAIRAMLAYGFEQMNLHRIYADTIADNTRSVAVLEKIGFVREGTSRESSWEDDGFFHDSALYGLLKREYAGQLGT